MGKKKKRQILEKLNIVPVTISYEFEPCDAQKIQELYISKRGTYKKQKLEDLNNIINDGYKPECNGYNVLHCLSNCYIASFCHIDTQDEIEELS